MSDYFSKRNEGKEVGPGPSKPIEWLIVQNPKDVNGVSSCVVVRAQTAFLAWEEAAKVIQGFVKSDCQCFPNPKLIIVGDKYINE